MRRLTLLTAVIKKINVTIAPPGLERLKFAVCLTEMLIRLLSMWLIIWTFVGFSASFSGTKTHLYSVLQLNLSRTCQL